MKRNFLSLLAAIAVVVTTGVASASVQFDLDHSFNLGSGGVVPPSSPELSPWVQVKIFDQGDAAAAFYDLDPGEVIIVIESNLQDGNWISDVALNVKPAFALAPGDFQYLGAGVAAPHIHAFPNSQGVDNSFHYDVRFQFGDGPGRFDGTDSIVIKAMKAGLTASDFEDVASLNPDPDTNPFYAAATINGIGTLNQVGYIAARAPRPQGADDDPIPHLPEPASLAIWGLGLGIAGLVRLRRKK